MKQLTKEEFLDRKNTNLHRELMEAFELTEQVNRVTQYMLKAREDYPKLLGCEFTEHPKEGRRLGINRISLMFVVQVTEMLKSGELVFKKKPWWKRLLNKESSPN